MYLTSNTGAGLPGGAAVKKPPANAGCKRRELDPWVRSTGGRRQGLNLENSDYGAQIFLRYIFKGCSDLFVVTMGFH